MAKIHCKSSYLLRKDTAENWQNKNPILRKGEQGLETDTGIIKIGDGVTAFNSLSDDNIYLPKRYANSTFANALKGSKSGSVILIDDVSPVTHEMRVKISSDTVTDLTAVKVSRCGKNLIPYPYQYTTTTYNGITFTDNKDGTITANGTATGNIYLWLKSRDSLKLKAGTYTLSGCPQGGSVRTYCLICGGSKSDYGTDVGNKSTFTIKETVNMGYVIAVYKGVSLDNLVFKPQLELGTTKTEYEPYTAAEYTPNADGTVNGVTSLYPNTTLMTDTDGVIIDCEYNRDINKAFAELQQAIISLGGNV